MPQLGVGDAREGAATTEAAQRAGVEHLGVEAVGVHVGQPGVRVVGPAHHLLAGDVQLLVLEGLALLAFAGGVNAEGQRARGQPLGDPAVLAVLVGEDPRAAFAQRRRQPGLEQVRGLVDVRVRRNQPVRHACPPSRRPIEKVYYRGRP